MPSQGVIKARGLNTSDNPLTLGEGWMRVAKNISVTSEGLIRRRNKIQAYEVGGFPIEFGTEDFHRTIHVDGTNWSIGEKVDGTYVITDGDQFEFLSTAPVAGFKLGSGVYGSDLFLSDVDGVMKIDSILGLIPAGLPTGDENMYEEAVTASVAAFSVGEIVAYRTVFGYTDTLGRVFLGSPGGRVKHTATLTNCNLTVSIPSEISSYPAFVNRAFVRVYRSRAVSSGEPSDDMYLAAEKVLSSADMTAGQVTVTDETPDDFLGVALYSNPDQEGILQSNDRPPSCVDMAEFGGSMFYANTKQRTSMELSLLSAARIGDSIVVDGVEYVFWDPDGLGAPAGVNVVPLWLVYNTTKIDLLTHTPSQAMEAAASWLCRKINETHPRVQAQYISGSQDVPGKFLLYSKQPGYQFSVYSNGQYPIDLNHADFTGPNAVSYSSIPGGGSGDQLGFTFPASFDISCGMLTGDSIVVTSADVNVPAGEKVVSVTNTNTFVYPEPGIDPVSGSSPDASFTFSRTPNSNFFPELPSAVSLLFSNKEDKKGRVYFSKKGFSGYVPTFNYVDVGNADLPVYRIIKMRESLAVIKQDGVYRIVGDDPSNFTAFPLDTTISIKNPWTVRSLSNRVFALSNIGVVSISDTGVTIISKPIESLIRDWIDSIPDSFNSFASESRREYGIIPDTGSSAYVYSMDSNSWVEWECDHPLVVGAEGENELGSDGNYSVLVKNSTTGMNYSAYIDINSYGNDHVGSDLFTPVEFEYVLVGGNPFSMKLFQEVQLIYSTGSDSISGTATMTASSIKDGSARTSSYSFSGGSLSTEIGTLRLGVKSPVARSNFLSVNIATDSGFSGDLTIYGVKVDASESEKIVGSANE